MPAILAGWKGPLPDAQSNAASCMSVTRNSTVLPQYGGALTAMLLDLVAGAPIKEVLESKAGQGLASVVKGAKSSPDPVVA